MKLSYENMIAEDIKKLVSEDWIMKDDSSGALVEVCCQENQVMETLLFCF